MPNILAVVVTYNRKNLLSNCLGALSSQTLKPDKILIIDNASTDGTEDFLKLTGWFDRKDIHYTLLEQNTGGAGGFAFGLQSALALNADWVWMMDDDASPQFDALEELMRVATDSRNIYGSLAISGKETAWETTLLDPPLGVVSQADEIPEYAEVRMLPLLGFLIHRELANKIGTPDAGFFIAGDDAEYCVRASRAGAKIIVASRSRIHHPKSVVFHINLLGNKISYLSLPPWKRYYDTRNRLLIARRHYGFRIFTQTIPGSLVRLFTVLLKEPQKLAQFKAVCAGLIDGLLGLRGKRHEKWGIKL